MYNRKSYNSLGPGFEPNIPEEKKGIPVQILLFLLASLILAGVSMMRFPKSLSEYRIYQEAKERMEQGETAAALQDLFEVLEEHPNSVPLILKLIDCSMEAGYYDHAGYVFNEYLVGKELTDSQYTRMMRYSNRLDSYYLTCDAMDALLSGVDTQADLSEEAAEELSLWFREEIAKLHKDPKQDQALLYYYDAMFSEDLETQRDMLRKAYEEDSELFDTRVLLANAERGLGNLTEAHSCLEDAISKEKQDAGALRGLSVLAMLEGREEEALALAKSAYEVSPDSLYVPDTYLVTLHVNGHTKEANTMIEEIEEIEGALDEDTRQLLNGEISLEDYYMGG